MGDTLSVISIIDRLQNLVYQDHQKKALWKFHFSELKLGETTKKNLGQGTLKVTQVVKIVYETKLKFRLLGFGHGSNLTAVAQTLRNERVGVGAAAELISWFSSHPPSR